MVGNRFPGKGRGEKEGNEIKGPRGVNAGKGRCTEGESGRPRKEKC